MAATQSLGSLRRSRILDSVRSCCGSTLKQAGIKKVRLRCFPLYEDHIQSTTISNPSEFHATLCNRIRNAERRVYLASLYIGPAADPIYDKEVELLQALQTLSEKQNIDVKILMDQNRGLRRVPVSNNEFITSADACARVLKKNSKDSQIFLLSVLPSWLQRVLKNPYNEVAGVFHLKAYIVDDDLIFSGANLSEEYFVDRFDRYLWIRSGGNGLVDCYAEMVKTLCAHAQAHSNPNHIPSSQDDLLRSIESLLTTTEMEEEKPVEVLPTSESGIVAYAVPTFQLPTRFSFMKKLRTMSLPSDSNVITTLITAAAHEDPSLTVRVASAYLNPTNTLLASFASVRRVVMLTAGRVSHGFKPKKKAGNKGKDWIPDIFATLSERAKKKLDEKASLWYYQRPDWSFHAKGLWLTNDVAEDEKSPRMPDTADLYVMTHGSGNYGGRSEYHDLESNLVLVVPEGSPLVKQQVLEWNQMCEYAAPESREEKHALSWKFKVLLPLIKSFF